MNRRLLLLLSVAAALTPFFMPTPAWARNPRNPYSSFNLSGINYGSQRWEQAQQQGRRVWPYYNTPSRAYAQGATVGGGVVGRGGAAVVSGGSSRRGLFGRAR